MPTVRCIGYQSISRKFRRPFAIDVKNPDAAGGDPASIRLQPQDARIGQISGTASSGGLEPLKIEYIPGVRERRSVAVAAVPADNTPFVSMTIPKANGRGSLDLQVKEVVRKVKAGQGNT